MPNPGGQAQARLGRYELLARLATGGMGEIFLARLEGAAGFEKLYVVKRILPHLADDARFRQMLIAEAQIAAKMAHGNICQVYELGETAGQLYIVMEYLEGVTMLPLMRRASKTQAHLELGFVAAVAQQTCDALHYAHELKDRGGEMLGLVHRDVTPSNIFLTDSGVVKVLDFGIAKAKGASSTKTEDGAVKGKYAYMAPEQLRGGAIDRRVDLFAFGVVLYEMVALRRLFQRKTDYLTFRAVMEQPIPDIRRYRPDIPDSVANVLVRALDRDPAQRFDTARQLGSALLDAMSDAGQRPWTQGDTGDFVKANFAQEMAKRSKQVASAVHRTQSGGAAARTTMPLIAHDEGPSYEVDSDEDEFPSVETDVDAAPPFVVTNAEPVVTDPFAASTPPPFAAEPTGSAVSLKPLGRLEPAAPVVGGGRSLVWPILAVAMIAIAGGALFLVWKQTQNQRPPAPPIILTQEPSQPPPRDAAPPAPPELGSANQPLAGGSATAPGHATERHPPKHYATYQAALNAALAEQKGSLTQCLVDHGIGVKDEMVAQIQIARSGKARSVQIAPPALNASPVGACLRNVLMATPFPTASKDNTISVPLKPRSSGG